MTLEVLIVITVFVFAIWSGRQVYNARKHRDATNPKTEVAKSAHEEPLTEAEIRFLKNKINRKMAGVVLASLLWFCIYLVVTYFFFPVFFGTMGVYLFWILGVIIFVTAAYLIVRRVTQLKKDIRMGKKLVIVGTIARWEKYPYNEDDYLLFIEEYSFRVPPTIFKKYAVGDALEVHLFQPWQNTVLFEKKI